MDRATAEALDVTQQVLRAIVYSFATDEGAAERIAQKLREWAETRPIDARARSMISDLADGLEAFGRRDRDRPN